MCHIASILYLSVNFKIFQDEYVIDFLAIWDVVSIYVKSKAVAFIQTKTLGYTIRHKIVFVDFLKGSNNDFIILRIA